MRRVALPGRAAPCLLPAGEREGRGPLRSNGRGGRAPLLGAACRGLVSGSVGWIGAGAGAGDGCIIVD